LIKSTTEGLEPEREPGLLAFIFTIEVASQPKFKVPLIQLFFRQNLAAKETFYEYRK